MMKHVFNILLEKIKFLMHEIEFMLPIAHEDSCNNKYFCLENLESINFDDFESIMEILTSIYEYHFNKNIIHDNLEIFLNKLYDKLGIYNFDYTKAIIKILQLHLLLDNFHHKLKEFFESNHKLAIYEIKIEEKSYPKFKSTFIKNEKLLELIINVSQLKNNDEILNELIFYYFLINDDINSILEYQKEFKNQGYYVLLFFYDQKKIQILVDYFHNKKKDQLWYKKLHIEDFDIYKILNIYLQKIPIEEKILLVEKCKSHKIIDSNLDIIFKHENFFLILVNTFNEENIGSTISIFVKLFKLDCKKAEVCLKHFILKTRSESLSNLFFDNCVILDHNFIEICLVYSKEIEKLKIELLLEIAKNEHFDFLINDFCIYKVCVRRILRNLNADFDFNSFLSILFKNNVKIIEKNFQKIVFILEENPKANHKIYGYFKPVYKKFKKIFKDKNSHSFVKETSLDLKKNFYKIISYMRNEREIQKYIKFFCMLDFNMFVNICIFQDSFYFDAFSITSINFILRNIAINAEKKIFFSKLINEIVKLNTIKTYWNSIVCKQFDLYSIIKKNNFLEEIIKENILINDQKQENLKKCYIENICNTQQLTNYFKNELNANQFNFDMIRKIIKRLNDLNKFSRGLVFNKSKIIVDEEFKTLCFYSIFYMYDFQAEQIILRLKGKNKEGFVSYFNGRFLFSIVESENIEKNFLTDKQPQSKHKNFGFKLSNKILKIYFNGTKHIFKFDNCKKLIIGESFKGIISRVLIHEGTDYNSKYYEKLNRLEFYSKHLNDLEKRLNFRHEKGIFIDTMNPFYIAKKSKIVFVNILINDNEFWIKDKIIRTKMLEISKTNIKMRQILEMYLPELLTTF